MNKYLNKCELRDSEVAASWRYTNLFIVVVVVVVVSVR